MKSQAGGKKSVGPGLPANRLATPCLGGRNFPFQLHTKIVAFFCSVIKIPHCLALKVYSLHQVAKSGFA